MPLKVVRIVFFITFPMLLASLHSYAQLSNNLLSILPDSCKPVPKNKKELSAAEITKIFRYAKNYAPLSVHNELDSLAEKGYKIASADNEDQGIQVLAEIVDYYTNIENYGSSIKFCDALVSKMEGNKKYKERVSYYRMIKGHNYARIGNYEQSIRYYIYCLDSAKAINDSIAIARIYRGIADPYDILGLYSSALACDDSSLAYLKNIKIDQDELEDIFSNKCWQCLYLYQTTGDKLYARMVQQFVDEAKKRKNSNTLFAMYPVGMAFIDKDYERVIFLSDSLLATLNRLSVPDQIYISHYINFRKGISLINTGKSAEGILLLKQLIAYYLATSKANLPSNYLHLSTVAQNLYDEYKKEKNQNEELFYLNMYKAYSDSLDVMGNRGAVFVAEQQYINSKKEAQVKVLESADIIHNKQKNLALTITIIVILSMVVITIFLYDRNQQLKLKKQWIENEAEIKIDKLQIASQLQIAGLEEKNRLVKQEEQKRMGKELHDNLGATIASISLKLLAEIKNTAHDASKNSMKDIYSLITNAYDETRNKSHNWYNTANKENNDSYANRITELLQTGLPAQYEKEIMIDNNSLKGTSLQAKIEMLYIIKEAVANIIKHSDAKKITILIYEDIPGIILSIADDGKGFKLKKEDGLGLCSIKERAASIGAKAEFLSGKNGTEVRVTLPA